MHSPFLQIRPLEHVACNQGRLAYRQNLFQPSWDRMDGKLNCYSF